MEGDNQNIQPVGYKHDDDEISLIDLWLVILNRKWMVIAIVLVCSAAGVVYTNVRPVQYQYRTRIDLARLTVWSESTRFIVLAKSSKSSEPNEVFFELLLPKKNSIDSLEKIIIPAKRKVLFGEMAGGPHIQIRDQKGTYSLILTSTARSEEAADVEKLHKTAALALAEEQDQILQTVRSAKLNPLKARARLLNEQIKTINVQLKTLLKRINGASEISELIYTQQIIELRRQLTQAKLELVDTESSAQAIVESCQGVSTNYLAAQSKSPLGPGNNLIIVLSIVLGSALGIFGAFLLEFFEKPPTAADNHSV